MSLQLPVISVVTPTFNRKVELAHLFNSMNKQTLDPKYFEMIISKNLGSRVCFFIELNR